jgi:hypothetical protein
LLVQRSDAQNGRGRVGGVGVAGREHGRSRKIREGDYSRPGEVSGFDGNPAG